MMGGNIISTKSQLLEEIERLKADKKKLQKGFGDLVFHCIDFNHSMDSFVLAMEIAKAREILREVDDE